MGDNELRRGFAQDIKTVAKANNKVVIPDPTGDSRDPVIKTTYRAVRYIVLFVVVRVLIFFILSYALSTGMLVSGI